MECNFLYLLPQILQLRVLGVQSRVQWPSQSSCQLWRVHFIFVCVEARQAIHLMVSMNRRAAHCQCVVNPFFWEFFFGSVFRSFYLYWDGMFSVSSLSSEWLLSGYRFVSHCIAAFSSKLSAVFFRITACLHFLSCTLKWQWYIFFIAIRIRVQITFLFNFLSVRFHRNNPRLVFIFVKFYFYVSCSIFCWYFLFRAYTGLPQQKHRL